MKNDGIRARQSKLVWDFFFADDAPEKKEITLQFFEKVEKGEEVSND